MFEYEHQKHKSELNQFKCCHTERTDKKYYRARSAPPVFAVAFKCGTSSYCKHSYLPYIYCTKQQYFVQKLFFSRHKKALAGMQGQFKKTAPNIFGAWWERVDSDHRS